MLVTNQAVLDTWFEKAANEPEVRRWLSPKTFLIPPRVGENTMDAMHFLVGEALVSLRFDRVMMEASIAMYNTGSIAEGAGALDEAYRVGYNSGPWRALRSACSVNNQRSMKLNRHVFGEPWGISRKSAWDAGLGEWADEAHFRRLREDREE
ncbi:MAG: hypothetical protein MUE79_01280 [Nitratireductor sp.]|jgi:hypothetical protein|nr:hypothetical protein [Nitratireductor sp.]